MQQLIRRRTRLVFETPFLIGKRPLIVAIEPLSKRFFRMPDLINSGVLGWS